jgi:hypothetical protein
VQSADRIGDIGQKRERTVAEVVATRNAGKAKSTSLTAQYLKKWDGQIPLPRKQKI